MKGVVTKVTQGRGRRRHRLRHRRASAEGGRGEGVDDPRQHQRDRQVPDRRPSRRRPTPTPPRRSSTSSLGTDGARRSWRSSGSARRDGHGAGRAGGPSPATAGGRTGAPPVPVAGPGRSSPSPSSPCRSSGCCGGRRGRTLLVDPGRSESSRPALRLSLMCSRGRPACPIVFGVPLAWVLARVRVPRPGRWCGRCARCRWCCRRWSAASPCSSRSAGGAWSASTSTAGSASRCRSRPGAWSWPQTFVAMPFLVITVEAALRQLDRALRGGRPHAGRVAAGTSSGGSRCPPIRPGADRRRRAGLGPGAGRVRRHDHLRRQLPGPHPDACRSPSTWRSRPTRPRRPSSSAWC